ncbi:MAG: hydroxymethylglutaryl-CoA lyase [Actinobacteria bacterium]|nr:MAG: hydroxymethylglutaryl-CoA lyase [Actinomycetota bacterium]
MRVTICDVSPRDGLQNEAETLEPVTRALLVNRLAAAGVPRVEAASFVRAEAVPQMAGAEEVVAAIERRADTEYSGLALNERGYERLVASGLDRNERGYERLVASGLDRVDYTLAATETFNQRNGNRSLAEAQDAADSVLQRSELPVTFTISVAFGCPFEGRVDPGVVAAIVERFADRAEIVLADTIGVATPSQVRSLVERTGARGAHLHNTRNTGYANALAALDAGATLLDASCGGLGGCPYAPRATGNIATEDLVYLLDGEGIDTGIDLDALVETSVWLEGVLGRRLEGYVYRAGAWAAS